jgi:hypothetical protein
MRLPQPHSDSSMPSQLYMRKRIKGNMPADYKGEGPEEPIADSGQAAR